MQKKSDIERVFDPLRRKYVANTPEEAVRQGFIHYLIDKRGWKEQLMMSEREISVNKLKFRCDIVCYNSSLQPEMIVECKAPRIKITQEVFEQIWRYALILKVKWLVVTNGIETFACRYNEEKGKYEYVNDIPYFAQQKTSVKD